VRTAALAGERVAQAVVTDAIKTGGWA